MKEPKIEDLSPELDDEALREALENLRRYEVLLVRGYKWYLLKNRFDTRSER